MIELQDVSFHYGGENGTGEGIDNVNLTIADGEFVVLVGRSGCGKTTLARTINGLAPNFYEGLMEGCVLVCGTDVTNSTLAETSVIVGSVFQNPKSQFFNVDSTGELVFGCENQGMPREQIAERLERTVADMKLHALLGRNVFELSGGEKQQIACGSVYTADPPVYVMDEPSSNLDKKAIQRLHDMLARIKAQGKTVVISEHRIHYLMDLADRFVYLDDGRVTRVFTADELRQMSDEALRELGLRCTSLDSLAPSRARVRAGNVQAGEVNGPAGNLVGSGGSDGLPSEHGREGKRMLEALDLSCARGSVHILDIERLELPDNSIVALIGDNGCGKSTLAESLCGVIPSSGSVAFDGVYLTDKERSRKSFMVMQDVNRQLFSSSVREEVLLNAPATEEQAEEILGDLGLGDCLERHPASLSGGQKQRVAIASALCAGKQIVFFDEPTSGLDRNGMERFGALLERMRHRVRASVIITHDPELVFSCCTHVMHVENGRVLGFYALDADGAERVRAYFTSPSDESTSKKRESISSVRRVLRFAGRYKRHLVAATALLAVGAVASVVPYLAMYGVVDAALAGGEVTLAGAGMAIALVLAGELVYALCYTAGLKYSHVAAYHTLENIRCHLQEKLEAQPLGTILGMGSGTLKKLFTDDVESMEMLLAHMIPEGIANLAVSTAVLLAIIAVDWQMGLLTAFVLLFGMSASRQMYQVGTERMGSYFAAAKRLNNTIVEYVHGMEPVRVFNRQGEVGRTFASTVRSYRDFALSWYKVCWPWMSLYGAVFAYSCLYALPLGAILVLLGKLELSQFVLVLCLCFALGPNLTRCVSFIGAFPQVSYKIQALDKTVDRAALKSADVGFCGSGHTVRFEDVRFAYEGKQVIRGVTFEAAEGQMTALVGPSGSGKSTLARLLAHHYDVESGRICIGGQDIRDMSLAALNEQVAYVSQDVFLFNKSIMENIRVGRAGATDEEVRAAARAACCEEFILGLAQGYDTLAGAAGSMLSGGQRQRIAFARAILKDAPIVVLDEASAHLDPENEQLMNDAIARVVAGKTVIVIAHKLRSIEHADSIVVLDDGRVSACGAHAELLATCPLYNELWKASCESEGWMIKEGAIA